VQNIGCHDRLQPKPPKESRLLLQPWIDIVDATGNERNCSRDGVTREAAKSKGVLAPRRDTEGRKKSKSFSLAEELAWEASS